MGKKELTQSNVYIDGKLINYGNAEEISLPDITEENCEVMAAELFKNCEIEMTLSCKVPSRLRLLFWYYGVRMQLKRMIFIVRLLVLQLWWKITGKI